jgi:hypothetical protein
MIKRNIRPLIEIAFVIILALPLVMYAWIGFFTRYVADDFWSAGYLRTLGFWGAQVYWYMSWTGRYTFTFLVTLAELMGPISTRWLPVTSLMLWTGALYWFFDGLFKLARMPYSRLIRLGAALLVLYTTLRTLVNWQQDILWQTGILTYTWPMIGLTLWSAWFLTCINRPEAYRPKWPTILLTVMAFWLLGGFSETSLAFQTTLLGLGLVFFSLLPKGYPHRRGALLLLAMGLAGSLIALLSVSIAPGNSVRLGQLGAIRLPPWVDLTYQPFHSAKFYLEGLFINSLRPMLCILGLPALFAFGFHPPMKQRPARSNLLWLASFLILFLIVILGVYWTCFLPAYVAMRIGPPLRSMIIMFFWLSLTFGIESYVVGLTLKRLTQWISPLFLRADVLRVIKVSVVLATFVLLVIGPLQTAQKLWRIWPEYRQFAIDWDARDQMARQAVANGINNASLPQLNDLYGLGPEASNQFARYYGLPGTVTFYSTKP